MALTKHWIVLSSALAFLIASSLGTHVHICFDGQEPPSAVHVLDGEHLDHHAGTSEPHNDVDVDPVGKPLPKPFKLELPALALLVVCAFVLLAPSARIPARSRSVSSHLSLPRYWRPLLRAPPR